MKGPEDTMYFEVLALAVHYDQFLIAYEMDNSRQGLKLLSHGLGLGRRTLRDGDEGAEQNDNLAPQDVGSIEDELRCTDTDDLGLVCRCTIVIDLAPSRAGAGCRQNLDSRSSQLLRRFGQRQVRLERSMWMVCSNKVSEGPLAVVWVAFETDAQAIDLHPKLEDLV
jgi:hypothetical protein